jgi:hypothetical protein
VTFSPNTAVDGRAEYSTDNGSTFTGWKYLSVDDRNDTDLQFFLVLSNPSVVTTYVDALATTEGRAQIFTSPQQAPRETRLNFAAVAVGSPASSTRSTRETRTTFVNEVTSAIGVAASVQQYTAADPTSKVHDVEAAVQAVGVVDVRPGRRLTLKATTVGSVTVIQTVTQITPPRNTLIDAPRVSMVGVPIETRLVTRHEPNTLQFPPILATARGNVTVNQRVATTTQITVFATGIGLASMTLKATDTTALVVGASATGTPLVTPVFIHPPTLVLQTTTALIGRGVPSVFLKAVTTTRRTELVQAVGVVTVTPLVRLAELPTTTQLNARAVAVGSAHTVQTRLTNIPPGLDPERTWPPRSRRWWNKRSWWLGG